MSNLVGTGYAASPGTKSLAKLKEEVSNFIKAPLSKRALTAAGDAIKAAVDKLNTRNWDWSLGSQDIWLVAGYSDFPLNPSFKSPKHLHLLDSDLRRRHQIGFRSWKQIEQFYPYTTEPGSPSEYTVYNAVTNRMLSFNCPISEQFIGLYPWARFRFLQRVSYPSSDSSPIIVPGEVGLFIRWWANFEMASIYRPDKRKSAREEAERIWEELIADQGEQDESDWDVDPWDN